MNYPIRIQTLVYYFSSYIIYVLGLQDAIARNLLISDESILAARVLAINSTTWTVLNCAWWQRKGFEVEGPRKLTEGGPEVGERPDSAYPW